jgi:hypothetical protein
MDKEYFRNMLAEILEAHGVDWMESEEIVESIVERCDEEGMFELLAPLALKAELDD